MRFAATARLATSCLCLALSACDSGADRTDIVGSAGAPGAAGAAGGESLDGGALPTSFYACTRANPFRLEPCEVALETFYNPSEGKIHCPPAQADAPAALCGRQTNITITAGQCEGLHLFRSDTEGVEGHRCAYDDAGQLVGAELLSDHRPLQYAGVSLRMHYCTLAEFHCTDPDAGPQDAGADGAVSDAH